MALRSNSEFVLDEKNRHNLLWQIWKLFIESKLWILINTFILLLHYHSTTSNREPTYFSTTQNKRNAKKNLKIYLFRYLYVNFKIKNWGKKHSTFVLLWNCFYKTIIYRIRFTNLFSFVRWFWVQFNDKNIHHT